MHPTPASSDSSHVRPLLALGGLVVAPLYLLSVGVFGLRALRPRVLRDAVSGAVAMGMVSLVGLGLSGAAWLKAGRPHHPRPIPPSDREHWRLPATEPLVPEGLTASAVSGY